MFRDIFSKNCRKTKHKMNLKPLILVDLPTLTPSCSYCNFNCSAKSLFFELLCVIFNLNRICIYHIIPCELYFCILTVLYLIVITAYCDHQNTILQHYHYVLLYPSWHLHVGPKWMYNASTKEVNNRWHADHHSRSFLTNRAARGTPAFAPSRWRRDLLQLGILKTAWCSPYSIGAGELKQHEK